MVARAVAAMLAVVALAGCGPTASSPTGASPVDAPRPVPSDDTPRVWLERQGGLAGRTETVDVGPDGTWTYSAVGGATRRGSLTPPQARSLYALANDPALAAEGKRAGSPPACAEGHSYALVLGERQLHATDCGKLPPKFAAVVTLLRDATPL